MDVQLWQMILVVIYGAFINYEKNSTMLGTYQPVTAGFVVGIILGDIPTGLFIGGSLQLMSLGISNFGGASVPDYQTAAIISTFITIATKQNPEIGITIGIPVALLMVQLDVIRNTLGIFLVNRAEKAVEKKQYKTIGRMQFLGFILTIATTGIPVLLAVVFGIDFINIILEHTPEWIITGLTVAGGMLPAVGIALLLRYLPVKDYISYLLIGFVLVVYMNVSILGVSIIAVAIALIIYKAKESQSTVLGVDEDE